tara:strand:- start:9287 stop:9964 length:678 start_codon:yes stop_codon:yes gene_type:complete
MFEKLKEQRRTIAFFAAIYLVFGIAFFYLMFMTPGLDFSQDETEEGVKIFVFNNSGHIIRGIEIETSLGEHVALVDGLAPREKQLLVLPELTGVVTLVARAPYHATATKSFSSVGGGSTGIGTKDIKLDYKVTAPSLVFIDFNFVAEIELCNKGDALDEIVVAEEHGTTYFKENKLTKTIALDIGICETLPFTLTPSRAGKTKIYFNVNALSYSKQIEKEISIEE